MLQTKSKEHKITQYHKENIQPSLVHDDYLQLIYHVMYLLRLIIDLSINAIWSEFYINNIYKV